MDEWPWDLLTPRRERWRLRGVAINGGITVEGYSPTTRTDGGGLWVAEQSFLIHGRNRIKAVRAIENILDGGIGSMVVWSHEAPFAPAGLTLSAVPHSDGTPFSDSSLYSGVPVGATLAANALKRATQIAITMIAGALEGGENFSIIHPTKGRRRYRIHRMNGSLAEIRPPLREAVTAGTEIDFLRVGCVCKLANPDDFIGALDAQTASNIIEAEAIWIEAS